MVTTSSGSVDVRPKDWDAMQAILSRFPEVREAYVYGSRADGTARPSSDIDIAVSAPGMSATRWSDLVEAFEESYVPWRTDVVRLDTLDPGPLMDSIRATGVPVPIRAGCREGT